MKKVVSIITIALIASTFSMPIYAAADDTVTNPTSTDVTQTKVVPPANLNLALEDALKLVEKNYNPVVLDDKYIEVLDKQYQQALANQQLYRENGIDDSKENEKQMLVIDAPIAKYNLENGKHKREIDFKNAKVTITNEYENILSAQLQKEFINKQIVNLQKDIDSINEKIKVGTAKASDIESDKATMAKYEASLTSAQNGIQSSMTSLKNDLGIDPITQVTLTSSPLEYVKYDGTDIAGKIKTAIANSFVIKTLPEQIDNAKGSYEIYKEFSDQQEDSTQISIEDLQNQLDESPKKIEVQLKIQYNALNSAEANVEADKLSIEAAQINLSTAQANYDQGQTGYLDVSNAELQLSNAQNTLEQDIISYMTASMNFQNSLEEQ